MKQRKTACRYKRLSPLSKYRFHFFPAEYSPSPPDLGMTRWHGITIGRRFFIAVPIARAAPGYPALFASSPYVTVLPAGTFLSTA